MRAGNGVWVALILLTLFAGTTRTHGHVSCTAAPSGIVSWWQAESNAVDIVSGNDGVSLTSVGFAPGKVGTAWSFDGVSSRILLGDPPSLAFTNSFSIEGWIWVNGLPPWDQAGIILYRGDSRYCQDPYYLDIPISGALRFHIEDLQQTVPCGVNLDTSPLPMHQWVHVAAVFDAVSGSMQAYVNGELAAHTNTPVRPFQDLAGGGAAIGGASAGQSGYSFNGLIDELSVYDRALAPSEIQAIYDAGSDGKCVSPVPPTIVAQPTGQTASPGSSVSFGVIAAGTAPLSYQWQKNGQAVSGATLSALTINNLQLSDAGAYSVIVTNIAGAITSSDAALTVTSSPPCLAPPAGMLAWWKGDGNANDSIGGNNGSLQAGTGFAAGEVGQAFTFNGLGQWVEIPDAPTLNPTNSLTLETWVYLSGTPNNDLGVVVTKQNFSVTEYEIEVHYANGRLNFRPVITVLSGYTYLDGTNSLQLYTWYHVALTYDGSVMRLYVNGVLDGSIAAAGPIVATPEPVKMGGYGTGPWNLNGRVDEVSLYNRALSVSEVQAIYNAGVLGKCTGLVPPTVLVQPVGDNAVVGDSVNFSVLAEGSLPLSYQWEKNNVALNGATDNSLTLQNVQPADAGTYSVIISNSAGAITSSGAVLTVSSPPPCTAPPAGLVAWWSAEGNANDEVGGNNGNVLGNLAYGPGRVGSAFEFDGTTTAIVAPASPSLTVQSLTIEAWIFPTDLNTPRPIVEYGDSLGHLSPLHFWYSWDGGGLSPGCLYGIVRSPGGSPYINVSSAGGLIPPNQWTHVALSFDYSSHTLVLYVNGVSVASASSPVPVTPPMNVPVNLGYRPVGSGDLWGGRRHVGGLDEVSIYNRVLSAAEISDLYQSGASGKCKAPTAPFVIVPPTNQTVIVGSTATFSVLADGTQPLSYQWSLAGAELAGATNATLILSNVQPSQAGGYSVQITNVAGSVTVSNAVLTVNLPPPCTPPPSGLVSWWQAEGDQVDRVGGNNGFLTNGASFAAGEDGQGFSFNGAHSFVEIPDSPSLSFTNDFSIELWYKDTGQVAGVYGGLIAKRPFGVVACNFGLSLIGGTPGTLIVYFLDPNYNYGDYQGIIYNNVPAAGAFHHVAATYHQMPSEQIQIKAYIDGQLVQASTFPGNLARTVGHSPVDIGASNFSGEFFKGIIDEVSIYNKLLSDTEIAAIYAAAGKGKCTTPVPAYVTAQPSGQTVVIGQTATFTASAAGSSPLSYQWFINGAAIFGATNTFLILTNVQMSQAGDYTLQVTNAYGSALSSNATLTVNFPAATVKAVTTSGNAGQFVTVPVVLLANGNENAVGFSLSFPPSLMANAGVTLGTAAAGGLLQFNTNQPGSVGVIVSLPSGATFAPGTQEVAEVSFQTTISGKDLQVPLSFVDVPTKGELSDKTAHVLPVIFVGGQVLLSRTLLEADVAPRPEGDGSVTVVDWVQVGRYVSGLDSATNAFEFERADCAPRSTLGDGLLTVSDWVQAGRYAAGLDPLTSIGGPTEATTGNAVSGAFRKRGTGPARILSVQGPIIFQGQTGTADVTLEAQGGENAVGLSLAFDPALVTYTGATLGSDASSATMDINANFASNGHVGIILGLPTNVGFTPGIRQVLKVSFRAVTTTPADAAIGLTDSPVMREIANTNALPVTAAYLNGTISVNPRPSLSIDNSNQGISLVWPAWATNYTLQQAVGNTQPSSTWTNVPVSPVLINNSFGVKLPLNGWSQFYRLHHE